MQCSQNRDMTPVVLSGVTALSERCRRAAAGQAAAFRKPLTDINNPFPEHDKIPADSANRAQAATTMLPIRFPPRKTCMLHVRELMGKPSSGDDGALSD